MTKISNQYSLTNILTADLANSRLGINNVSPAYSLDLTGTARVTTSAYFATTSGSVGIGTTSPSTKLHVYEASTSSSAHLTIQNNRTRNAAVLTQTTNGGFYAGTSIGTDTFNYQIYDAVAGEARLTIASTGAATFQSVNAKVNTGGWHLLVQDNTSMAAGVGGGISFNGYKTGTSAQGVYAAIDGIKENGTSANELGAFRIWTSNGTNLAERLRITSAGNVAINNTTGTIYSKLSVAGAISFNNNTNSAVSGGEYGNAYAKTISVIAGGSAVSIKPGLGPESSLILVSGRSTTGNRFSDLILVIGQGTTAPTVIASRTYLSPATRTYTNGGESLILQLTGSSETYTIFLTGIGGNESS